MDFLIDEGYHKKTSDVPDRESFAYWRDLICDEFVQLDCEPVVEGGFKGELRGGGRVSDLRFSEVVTDPQRVIRSRRKIAQSTEEEFLISFQVAQQGIVRQNNREAILQPGSFALYDSTEPYTLSFDQPFHQLIVQIPKDVMSRHLINPEQYTAIPISAENGLGAVLKNLVFSLATELSSLEDASDELSENLLQMIAMAFSSSVMLEQIHDSSVGRESLKRRILQYIDHNLCDPELNNGHIAQAQGISKRYLNKLFQNDSETIHTLILGKRLQKARTLLADPRYHGHSIERIAFSVGFSNAGHFSRSFKKAYGINPSELR